MEPTPLPQRAANRRREIAVRLAIGAQRGRLIRQLMIEAVVLFAAGGAIGIVLSRWLTSMLMSVLPALPVPVGLDTPTDWRVLMFAVGLSLATALLSGLAPALQASGSNVVPALKTEGMDSGPTKLRLRSAFVVGQITMSLLLVIAAGLFLRALQHAANVQPGFNQERVDVLTFDLSIGGFNDQTGRAFVRESLQRISALPGVESATASVDLPLDGGTDGRPQPVAEDRHEGHERQSDRERRCGDCGPTRVAPRVLAGELARRACHRLDRLAEGGRFPLMIWPYHAMLGGVGHSLVATIEEALFVHSVARGARLEVEAKGGHPLTEHYSALGPEVREDADGRPLVGFAEALVDRLLAHDAIAIAGQAKSHCVNWTVRDLIDAAQVRDPALIGRIHLLEDCSSPVVVPGADFTDAADAAFARFAAAGAHVVRSTDPVSSWPGLRG